MGGSDGQGARADEVTRVAEDFGVRWRVVGDTAIVLLVLNS